MEEAAIELIKIMPGLLWIVLVSGFVYLFRDQINALLSRVANVKVGDIEVAFVKNELDRVASESRGSVAGTSESRNQVARRAGRIRDILKGSKVLLVNDVPSQMSHIINILENSDVNVTVAKSTEEAIDNLERHLFDLVISDMKRGDMEDAGIRMLNKLRKMKINKPIIFTVGQYDPGRGVPPYAFGITNRIDELMNLIFDAIERIKG